MNVDEKHQSGQKIRIYTDGSCSPNPGPGGWAAVLLFANGKEVELSGSVEQATNNRMELLAALKALESLEGRARVEIFTDSTYLQHGITGWLGTWQRNGWRTVDGADVKNRDLWEQLADQLRDHAVSWSWVRGHAGNHWNTRADELAAEARRAIAVEPRSHAPNTVHLYPAVTWKKTSGSGGWAAVLRYRNHLKVVGGREEATTANRLQLIAVIESVEALKRVVPVTVHSRSGYLRDGLESWIHGWSRRGWQRRDGGEVGNRELWQKLARLKEAYVLRVAGYSADLPPCHAQEAKEMAREYEQLHSG